MQTEDDGYDEELQSLNKILNILVVQLPSEPLRQLERFRRDFKEQCERNKVHYNPTQADGQWLELSESVKQQYQKLCEREEQSFARLQELKMLLGSSKQNGAYLNYHKEQSNKLKGLHLNNELIQADIAKKWKALSKAQKAEYAQKIRLNPVDKQELKEEYKDRKEQYERDHAEVPKQIVFFDKFKGKENMEKGNQIDEVDMIIGLRKRQGKKEYLVRWKGKTGADATWVTKKWLKPLRDMVRFFHESYYSQHFEGDYVSSGYSSTPVFQEDDQAKSIASRPKSQISKVSKVSKVSKEESIQQKQQLFKPQILIKPALEQLPLPKSEIQNQIQAEPIKSKVTKDSKPDVVEVAQEEHKSSKEVVDSNKNKKVKEIKKIVKKQIEKQKVNNDQIISKLRSSSKSKPIQSQDSLKSLQDTKSKKYKKVDKLSRKLDIKQRIVADQIPEEPIVKPRNIVQTKKRESQTTIQQSQQDQTLKVNKKQETSQQQTIKTKPDRLKTILAKKVQSQISKFTTKIGDATQKSEKLIKTKPEEKTNKAQAQSLKQVIPKKTISLTKKDIREALQRITRGRQTRAITSILTKTQPEKEKKESKEIVQQKVQKPLKSQKGDKAIQVNTRAILAKKEIPLIVKQISKQSPDSKLFLKTRSQVRQHLG